MNLRKTLSFNCIRFPFYSSRISNISRSASCPGNLEKYRISKIANRQVLESIIEETLEYNQDNDPILKLFGVIIFNLWTTFTSKTSKILFEGKIKEITIRLMLHYIIHELFYTAKHLNLM
jgi:hypothetical protein